MKQFLIIFVSILTLSPVIAQDNYQIMDWKTDQSVRTYLLYKIHKQYDQRRSAIQNALKSPSAMEVYRDSCRARYRRLLGAFPEKTPLNPQITRMSMNDGFRLENVIYKSRPNHHVTANLYVPDGRGPFPGVLFFCGHEMTSKATESYQKTAILFAKNGFVVLVIDPISQGERVQFTDENGKRILRGSTTEHTLLNAGANLVGTNVVTYELYDNVRSLDYLLTRPEVDPDRIGCLGNSGGGSQTQYFVGFDDRVKVAAPCCNISRRERNLELTGANDGCQQMPFEGREMLEIGDFLIMFAPKPLLILAGTLDFVDYYGTEQTFEELRQAYNTMGYPENVSLFAVDDGHGISQPKREAAVRWFRRWFYQDDSAIHENNLETLPEESLNCTPDGQVNAMFSNEVNVQHINMKLANDYRLMRENFCKHSSPEIFENKIRKLLGLGEVNKTVNVEIVRCDTIQQRTLQRLIIRRTGEIPLPCLMYSPIGKQQAEVILWLNSQGKAAIAAHDSLFLPYVSTGSTVLIADLRCIGETTDRPEYNHWKYYNDEYNNASFCLHLGETLVGQRVVDIFTLLDFLEQHTNIGDLPITIIANERAALPALHAAALDKRIHILKLSDTIRSYMEILERPMEKNWYSYVIPNALLYYDVPDLVAFRNDLEVQYDVDQ
ncbi:acetylxylan esterase [candidate division KSB1 bacterium]|nr:acetylxylan esterase [candidate division KSB1 bacterium]